MGVGSPPPSIEKPNGAFFSIIICHIDNISAHEKWLGFKIDPSQQSISNDVFDELAKTEQNMLDEFNSFEFHLPSFILDYDAKTTNVNELLGSDLHFSNGTQSNIA